MGSLITADLKPASRRKLVEFYKSNALRLEEIAAKAANSETKRLEAAQRPLRRAFLAELKKQRGWQAIHTEYDQALGAFQTFLKQHSARPPHRAVLEKGMNDLGRTLDGIEERHRAMLHVAAKRSIKRDEYLASMIRAYRGRGRIKLKEDPFGGLRLSFVPNWTGLLTPILRPLPQTSFVLTAPFDQDAVVTEEFSALSGVIAGASADPNDGFVDVALEASLAGYQMGRAQLGAFLTIPPGFSMLKLQARITGVDATVLALAIGASWASSGESRK